MLHNVNCTTLRHVNCTTLRHVNCTTLRHVNCTTLRHVNCTTLCHVNSTTLCHVNILPMMLGVSFCTLNPTSRVIPSISTEQFSLISAIQGMLTEMWLITPLSTCTGACTSSSVAFRACGTWSQCFIHHSWNNADMDQVTGSGHEQGNW